MYPNDSRMLLRSIQRLGNHQRRRHLCPVMAARKVHRNGCGQIGSVQPGGHRVAEPDRLGVGSGWRGVEIQGVFGIRAVVEDIPSVRSKCRAEVDTAIGNDGFALTGRHVDDIDEPLHLIPINAVVVRDPAAVRRPFR